MNKLKSLFILSGNLSTTPRALKSILYFKKSFDIDIVAINRSDLWLKIDKDLCSLYNLDYKVIDLANDMSFSWFVKSIKYKFYSLIAKILKHNIKVAAFGDSKASLFLTTYLRKSKKHYKFISGNSFGSLYPAYYFSKKQNIPFIFDIEDYYPGEKCSVNQSKRREFLMKKILPKAKFITYASPMIGEKAMKLLKNYPISNYILINNSFPESEFQFFENNSEKIKFVWFSQNIAQGRGLEMFIPVLEKFKDKVELTIIGNLYESFYEEFLIKYIDFVKIEKPLPLLDLNLKLSEFDIGLAIESSSEDLNKKIALSNKIFEYAQAGLYILATNTPAQVQFLEENINLGIYTEQNDEKIYENINKLVNDISKIRLTKKYRFKYSQKFSWENESKKLSDIWKKISYK